MWCREVRALLCATGCGSVLSRIAVRPSGRSPSLSQSGTPPLLWPRRVDFSGFADGFATPRGLGPVLYGPVSRRLTIDRSGCSNPVGSVGINDDRCAARLYSRGSLAGLLDPGDLGRLA